jgi:pimeloyl-ACP methyl ester carboxylesterase
MPSAVIDGITTRYDVIGSGRPVLMFAPGGFDATIEKWTTQGIYAKIRPVEHLSKQYTCIVFDRRESGESGGRVEAISWAHYAAQAKGLLDHLGIARTHVLGACMGCPPAMALAVAHPQTVASLVLYWPVGGAHYRINSHARLVEHLAYVDEHGLDGVVALIAAEGKTFNQDPRGGIWASVIRREPAFAAAYVRQNVSEYTALVVQIRRNLFDRDSAPGTEPEELMRLDVPALVVPGRDKSHATSAARFLEECLPRAEYWDVAVADQTETTVLPRLFEFLDRQEVKT